MEGTYMGHIFVTQLG